MQPTQDGLRKDHVETTGAMDTKARHNYDAQDETDYKHITEIG